jgi:hypothetical protein
LGFAALRAFDFLAALFAPPFLATTRFALLAEAFLAFLAFLPAPFFFDFLVFDFAFFAMIVLPIVATQNSGYRLLPGSGFPAGLMTGCSGGHLPFVRAASAGVNQLLTGQLPMGQLPISASGLRPPVAQSISSTVWTTGIAVPAAICVMQPILPAAIASGASLSIFPTLRSRNLLAMSGCKML